MHSMLRQNQVRVQDVKPYLRGFTRSNPLDLAEWAKDEGSLFEPGTLLFLLEPAKRPPGMSSFARGQAAPGPASDLAQDAFRVKDMCVVVDKIEGKCWVLAISPSAFELRFIDTLFREKTQKAFLEGLDLNYLAAQPRPPLTPEKLKELRQLSTLYSKSGSRRTVAQDGSGPEEPAKAMLGFLGADLGQSTAKQVMELGSICNMIFAPESAQENKLQSMVKSCFSPILATDKLKGHAAPPPSTAAVITNQELFNEEVSLLSQTYLDNEAKEAEDFLKYSPPDTTAAIAAADKAASESSGVWTSAPAAAASAGGPQSTSADEFRPLEGPPPAFDLGGFPSAPPVESGNQPVLSLSPDIPSILTGEHPVLALDAKLVMPEESNGSKVPSLPAWYMTTHDIDEMNEVALRRAQQTASMPEGLDRLESELSYDALPVVDTRFRAGEGEPAASVAQELSPAAAPAQPVAEPARPQMMSPGSTATPPEVPPATLDPSELSGAWAAPAAPQGKDFVDSIFENAGAGSTLETSPDARAGEPPAPKEMAWDALAPGATARGADAGGFVSPGSTALPVAKPESADGANLFDRLGGSSQAPPEEASAHAWADGARGVPTNLKDMLTADSAVFTTSDRGKFEMPAPMPLPEPPPQPEAQPEPPAAQTEPAPAGPSEAEQHATASGVDDEAAPAPWMKLPHHDTPEAASPLSKAAEEEIASTDWQPGSGAAIPSLQPAAPDPVAESPPTQEDYTELAVALNGLMDSPEAMEAAAPEPAAEPSSAVETSSQLDSASYQPAQLSTPSLAAHPPTQEPAGEHDLFENVMDKVLDLAESEPGSEPEAEQDTIYEDNRELTQDLDAAMLQQLSLGHATLTSHAPQAVSEETPEEPAASSELDSLVPPDMAAHAHPTPEPEPQEPTAPEAEESSRTPIRPLRPRPGREPLATPPAEPVPSASELPATPPAEPVPSASELPATPPAEPVPSASELSATPSATPSLFGDEPADVLEAPVPEPPAPLATEAPAAPLEKLPALPTDESVPAPATTLPAEPVLEPALEELTTPPAVQEESTAPPVTEESFAPATPAPAAVIEPVPPSEPALPAAPAISAEPVIPTPQVKSSLSLPGATISQEIAALDSSSDSGVFSITDTVPETPPPGFDVDTKITASGLQRAQQPAMEPKLVISESTRFMARLNQRLSEADKKLSSRCDQSRDRLLRELDALVEEAHKVERQTELTTGTLTEQLMTHLETVSEEVKARITKTSAESCGELEHLIRLAEETVMQMNRDLQTDMESTESTFQDESEKMTETTRLSLNNHAQTRVNEYNKKLEEIAGALEVAYKHHISVLEARFQKFQARLSEEVDAIITSLDRNVGSMTVEIDGSWDRASEKLTASQTEFGNSVSYLVHSCRADIKQVHLDAYARKVLPRLLENKDIFRSMLLDMKRNFEEQSDKIRKQQLSGLAGSINNAKAELNTLTKECLSTIESVGKGQQFGLEDLFKNTSSRLEEIITTVESKLKTARQEIVDNDEACMKTSELSRVEDEPAFSREKQQAIAALNECRTKADNALETHISSSCLNLEHLSESMQEDLAKQRQDWTSQVRATAEESISQIKQAIQDAFQAIETAKERHME